MNFRNTYRSSYKGPYKDIKGFKVISWIRIDQNDETP